MRLHREIRDAVTPRLSQSPHSRPLPRPRRPPASPRPLLSLSLPRSSLPRPHRHRPAPPRAAPPSPSPTRPPPPRRLLDPADHPGAATVDGEEEEHGGKEEDSQGRKDGINVSSPSRMYVNRKCQLTLLSRG
ncbi:proline-rich receptor-like protein kinase PERK10 [Triticum urartu]|uniref:proline-rich receptor-like protein kinase PERK10 n=1 Tax=Triticum urartu TaxID=4572 RepID=UPI002044A09D|nr:proline-rich receptor-like protein kinase PERK10 [Triticum urartu]